MKKGFTLIEVLAVLVVIAVVGMIAVPAINSSINESKQKSYDSQVQLILEAAKSWAVHNNDLLPIDDSTYKLPLATLISEQYISNVENGKLKNPKDSANPMNGCVHITYSESYNQYLYEYKDEC